MKRVLDATTLQVMSLFFTITHVELKDCILEEDSAWFVVDQKVMGRAIGKQGANIRRLEKALKRRVKIVGYSDKVLSFIQNLYYPLKMANIREDEGVVIITPLDLHSRGQLIGRAGTTLRRIEGIVKRYFPITEIKIEQWSKNHEA